MPIPVNNINNNNNADISLVIPTQAGITIQEVFSQVVDIILSSRLDHHHQHDEQQQEKSKNYCLLEHENCCLGRTLIDSDNTCCIVINILQKESDVLLERWMMSFDIAEQAPSDDMVRFLQNVSNFIRQMPAKNDFIDMYTIASLNNNDEQQCHSHISTQDRIEFRSDAHLKAHRFHLPSLSLEVVFDENASNYYNTIKQKKPIISLQSLSSPLFMSWSKMQQQQQQKQQNTTTDSIHPLSAISPLSPTMTIHSNTANNNTPIIAVRRLSRLSLSAMQLDDEEEEKEKKKDQPMEDAPNTASYDFAIPIPSPRMQYTHHSHHTGHCKTVAYSTSPNNNSLFSKSIPSFSSSSFLSPITTDIFPLHQQQQRRNSFTGDNFHHGCLVGSFEESLLSGRMSSMPSKPITFHCQIGVLGYDCKPSLKCPPHWSIVFPAMFYKLGDEEEVGSTPYVGTVDIQEHVNTLESSQPGYRIPPKGQLQVVVKNPNKTAVKLFLIPYDFTDMPKNTKTFLRQKSYTIDTPQQLLRYAIHIQVCRTEKKRIYLYKSMRIVFANRKADAREKFNVVCEGPKAPVYIPM